MSRGLRDALLVALAFVAVHLLLMLGTFDVYDLEETEYGNVALALLDGRLDPSYASLVTDPEWGDGLMTGAGRRRRTVWSIEPTVLPFFAALGPTMFSLKLWALVLAGLWAASWFRVARVAFPRAPRWVAAALFVIPLPLVQRAAVSATSITAHLGSSLWQGASMAVLLLGGRAACVAAGLLAGLGLATSFSIAPLLLGPAILAWTRERGRGLLLWGFGLIPGVVVALAFRDPGRAGGDLVTALTGLQDGGTFRGAGVGTVVETAWTTFTHGAGFGRVDPTTAELAYLPVGAAYVLVLLALPAIAAWTGRGRPRTAANDVVFATAASFGAFALVLLATGFKLETDFFDGLRYLLPLTPIPALVVLACVHGAPDARRAARVFAGPILAMHLAGFVGHFRADVFPAPWWGVHGYEPWVMKNYLQGDLDFTVLPDDRAGRWALWAGLSHARRPDRGASRWDDVAGGLPADGSARDEYLRGLGIGLVLEAGARGESGIPELPTGAPPSSALRVLEGMAMGQAHVGCSAVLRDAIATRDSSDEGRAAVWYGFGRADLYCRLFDDGLPADADEAAFARGRKAAVERDYGPAIEGLVVY